MAKSILPIAAASLASLLAGVVLTLVFTAEALETLPDDATDPLRDVVHEMRATRARLERVERVLERELSATRRDVRGALDARASGDAEPRVTPEAAAAVASTHVSRDASDPLGAKNLAALGPLAAWASDATLRSEWMFASEKAALGAFGIPDEVSVRGAAETWTYWNVEGESIPSEYRVQFNNGRLVAASLVTWRTPRALPTASR